jgi:ribosomal protein L13E
VSDLSNREKICRDLGLGSPASLHSMILAGVKKAPTWLVEKGLNAQKLASLGYTLSGMKKIGYGDSALKLLGFKMESEGLKPVEKPPAPHLQENPAGEHDPRVLLKKGYTANELRQLGITLHECKRVGIDARDLFRIGFDIHELVGEFTLLELKRLGFNPRELKPFFDGQALRDIGFSGLEMRCAGFSVRDLLNFGFNENQIIGAGYSTNELIKEGLSRITSDMRSLH